MVHVPPDVADTRHWRIRALIALLRGLGFLAARLPRRTALGLTRVGGAAWYLLAPRTRGVVHDNVQHVLRRAPRPSEVRGIFHFGALNYWDTLALPHLSRN